MTGPRNDPNADWASCQQDFPDDLHGNTRGKCYAFKHDGRCPECLVEACERQQAGGFGAGLPRGLLRRSLVYTGRPYVEWGDRVTTTVDGQRPQMWTVDVRLHGE